MHWQIQEESALAAVAEPQHPEQLARGVRMAAAIPKEQVEDLLATYHPRSLRAGKIDWVVFGWMLVMHLGCLAAPFYFTWPAFYVAVFFYWLTGSIGICLGYHRFLSHRGFKLAKPVRFFVDLCGCLSGEGSPLTWVATHRLHHARSDRPGDPHSPHEGGMWSHILWLFVKHSPEEQRVLHERFAPDLVHDPMMQFFEKTYILWSIALGAILFAVGGLPMLIWGMAVRLVAMYHSTWLVNSATHLWGYRSYETKDDSRNNWFVALVSFGEGWHNNHHAHPRMARAGHRWWEVDITYWVIYLMKKTGMATEVIDQVPARR